MPTSGSRLMGNDDGMRVPGNLRFMGNNDGMRVRENLRIPQILNHDSNYISETVTEEAEASSSLSTRYRYRKPPSTFVSTQEGGVSNTTTSQDYTGSSEGMENAELNLVAKKYPDSGTEGIDVAAQNTAEQGPTSDLGTQDGLVSEEVNVSSGQLNGTGEPLLDDGVVNFDFASLMPQVGEGIDSLNSDMSGYVDSHRRERDTQLLPTTRTVSSHEEKLRRGNSKFQC